MNTESQRYHSGEQVHAGDLVQFSFAPGVVVFVNDNVEYEPGFSAEEWGYLGAGFMLRMENGALIFLEKADEDLVLVHRG